MQDERASGPNAGTPSASASTDLIRNTSDDVLAADFTDAHQRDVRYVGQWNKWLTWEGDRWDFDHRLGVYTKARSFLRMVAIGLQNAIVEMALSDLPDSASEEKREAVGGEALGKGRRAVKPIQSARTIHNVVSLTRYDKRVASSVDEWDRDPWLLNTPDGTVNLRTGSMRGHRPTDYITRVTAVGPKAGVPVQWLAFLRTIMHGDDAMLTYLQKVFGYCLVGETKEHQMYFGYGTGANGKGVTLNTMRGLLGDYGIEAAIETFIVNDGGVRHPTELADLRGARLVTCGETDQGQRWAEARIKMLTGGDPVKARFMRMDFFTYQPQFKLFLAGNHKPKLSNVDEAIERRFRLIPFTYHVPKAERDLDLAQKLRAEWPLILNWAIEGCLAWQREGLAPPEAVDSATKGYLSREDALSEWLHECCVMGDGFALCSDLFESWAGWARETGEPVGTKRQLTLQLEDREPVLNIRRGRRTEGIGFVGMELAKPLK